MLRKKKKKRRKNCCSESITLKFNYFHIFTTFFFFSFFSLLLLLLLLLYQRNNSFKKKRIGKKIQRKLKKKFSHQCKYKNNCINVKLQRNDLPQHWYPQHFLFFFFQIYITITDRFNQNSKEGSLLFVTNQNRI